MMTLGRRAIARPTGKESKQRSTATEPGARPPASPPPKEGEPAMTGKRLFLLNAVIAGGYGLALLVATDPILDLYGITPNPQGVYMARWFGLELLAIGLVTWLAREAAESAGGRAIARALAVGYGIGVALALWGTLFGPSTSWAGSRWA
jgi:hypothetical protein